MDADEGDKLVHETFGAIAQAGCRRWEAECAAMGEKPAPEDRADYLAHFRGAFLPEFKRMAAQSSGERLAAVHGQWAVQDSASLPARRGLAVMMAAAVEGRGGQQAKEGGREGPLPGRGRGR